MGNSLEFVGKVALITGRTRGIGAATARRVAELGADVVITGITQPVDTGGAALEEQRLAGKLD